MSHIKSAGFEEGQRLQPLARQADSDNGEIQVPVESDHSAAGAGAVNEFHANESLIADNVRVGHDMSVTVDQETRSAAAVGFQHDDRRQRRLIYLEKVECGKARNRRGRDNRLRRRRIQPGQIKPGRQPYDLSRISAIEQDLVPAIGRADDMQNIAGAGASPALGFNAGTQAQVHVLIDAN